MRGLLTITFLMLATALCPAQQQEGRLSNLLETNMNNIKSGMPSALNNKSFQSAPTMDLKKSADKGTSYFSSKKSYGSESFTTRNFLGVKNPWFGKKVFTSDAANLLSKSDVANSEKKFAVNTSQAKAYKDSKKGVNTSTQVVEEKTFIAKGKAQGALDESKKDLSIDDVRSILNKNH